MRPPARSPGCGPRNRPRAGRSPPAIGATPRLPAGCARSHRPRNLLRCAARSHGRIRGYLNATPHRRRTADELGAVFRRRQRPGATERREGGLCDPTEISSWDRLMRCRPLPNSVSPLPGDRVHRARIAGDHGRRGRRPAEGPAPARAGVAASYASPTTSGASRRRSWPPWSPVGGGHRFAAIRVRNGVTVSRNVLCWV